MLYRNMSIYCNTLGAIYRYGEIQYRPNSNRVLGSAMWEYTNNKKANECDIVAGYSSMLELLSTMQLF